MRLGFCIALGLLGCGLAGPAAGDAGDPPSARPAYWVFFRDRGSFAAPTEREAIDSARAALSPRALARRAKVGAPLDLLDLPPAGAYAEAVRSTGARLRVTSRWLNAVSVEADDVQVAALRAMPFVAEVRRVAARPNRPRLAAPVEPVPRRIPLGAEPRPRSLDYGACASQILPIQVDQLHDAGYSGAGVLVCMLDTGFLRTHESLDAVDVVAEHDFVQGDGVTSNQAGDDPGQHNHGTYCLSLLAGWAPGDLIGPAYGASFALGKTETISSESPLEEDWWVAGAEWADSLGADVISSSVGYKDWLEYEDLDGNTAVVTIGADLAVASGICVINAAGNEGDDPWLHVIAPADGDSVIAAGAVDSLGVIAAFSSRGPTFDGRTKPDVCAMGKGNLVALPSDDVGYGRGSGTSFSAPLVAGVAALLLEAHPNWGPIQVREALRTTADRASAPDDDYGWGVVQAADAVNAATTAPSVAPPARGVLLASPNPSRDVTTLRFSVERGAAPSAVTIHDVAGRLVRTLPVGPSDRAAGALTWDGRDEAGRPVASALYFARARGGEAGVARIVRLR
jgi:subtilisin family serine protease